MSMNELEAKVAELRELRRMAEELRELRRIAEELAGEIAATEDTLKAYMTANGADELYGPSFKITWKEVTSSRLDSKALKSSVTRWQSSSPAGSSAPAPWRRSRGTSLWRTCSWSWREKYAEGLGEKGAGGNIPQLFL